MAIVIEEKDRRVIPNWRPFNTTVLLGELSTANISPINRLHNLSIDSYVEDYKSNKSIPFASELISASLVNRITDNPVVHEAASFILKNSSESTQSQQKIAKEVLLGTNNAEANHVSGLTNITINELGACLQEKVFREKIHNLKQYVINFPYNVIAWVELSRCYSILGQEEQALRSMKVAVQLSPNNRYVIRCATRLFSHYGEIERAQYILRHNDFIKKDPWLLSADIAVATMQGRMSPFLKKGIELVDSNNYQPLSITELSSSIATVYLLNGEIKKSRKMFAKALISPNDNSDAQMEWALKKERTLFDKSSLAINPQCNFEALTLSSFYNNNLIDALNHACQWFCDMPFSKQPVILGSSIADVLDNKQLSIAFLEKGIISHPDDWQILNNLSYYYALSNQLEAAKKYIGRINYQNITPSAHVCATATKGLISFREKNYEAGRNLYLKAIEETSRIHNLELNWIAILNYAREEIIAKSEYIEDVMSLVSKINPQNCPDIIVKKLYQEVEDLYKKYKMTSV